MLSREQATEENDQRWQAVLDSAGEGIWGVDLEGNCTFVNRSALEMLGFSAEELLHKNMHALIHHHYPDGQFYPGEECVVYQVFGRGQPFKNQVDHLFRKDGSLFWAEMSAQPIVFGGAVHGAVVTFRDITRSLQAGEALRRSEKLAAVGQLASSIAHEINNPLEAVTNLLYLVRTSDTIADMKTYAALAEVELARVVDITTQTLRFHRQQSAPAPADLGLVLRSVVKLHGGRMMSRGVEPVLDIAATPPALVIEGDIRQVLNNLVRNAYEAMPEGGRLRLRLRTTRWCGEESLLITVADTGQGFSTEGRANLFVPFHTTKEVTGTGLGLWISKEIVEKHRGTIRMRSRARTSAGRSHGTVFTVRLPVRGGMAPQGRKVPASLA